MIVLGLVIGVILALVCTSIGVVIGISIEKSRKPKPPSTNMCDCGHYKSFHRYSSTYGKFIECYKGVCSCRHFVEAAPALPVDPFLEAARKELGI